MNACGGAVRGQHDLRPPFVLQLRPHRRLWTVAADTASAGSWGGEVGTRGQCPRQRRTHAGGRLFTFMDSIAFYGTLHFVLRNDPLGTNYLLRLYNIIKTRNNGFCCITRPHTY